MAITLSATFVENLLNHDATAGQSALADQIGGGTLIIYSGTAPTGANESLSGNTVLVTFTLLAASSQTSAGAGGSLGLQFSTSGGSGTATNPTMAATATGTATFFRIASSGATSLIQGTVATTGGDWNLTNTSINSGDNITITGTPTISLPVT